MKMSVLGRTGLSASRVCLGSMTWREQSSEAEGHAKIALKFVDNQNFVTSTIIGATSLEQLKSNIDAFDISLSSEVMEAIQSAYRQFPIVY
jgi:aryl-alcohol dehydrogenase-like predicted oxidoreductase